LAAKTVRKSIKILSVFDDNDYYLKTVAKIPSYSKENCMVENLYSSLADLGYTHPLHPTLTHVPMGLIIGMVIFSVLGLFWKNKNFDHTAFHCSVLALVSIPPVIAAGFLDWLHFQQGEWNVYIIVKMILAGVLTVLLILCFIMRRKGMTPGKMLLIYFLCLVCAGGLGYAGGTLVYG
jgi:uncharacterized membrane protein